MEKSTVVILVCCAYFSIMILVGILVMARNRKASDFLVAGRKLSLPFTVATLSAVQIGAGIILGGSSTAASMGVGPGMWYSLGCGGGLIIAGIFVAGDSFYASNCYGHAATTGHYTGRHAAEYAEGIKKSEPHRIQVHSEKERVYGPVHNQASNSIGWKELNMGISKIMRVYCGESKHDELLRIGLKQLTDFENV